MSALHSLLPSLPPTETVGLHHAMPFVWEYAPVGMAMATLDGHIEHANPAFCQMLGYREAELRALSWQDLTHPDDVAHNQAMDRRMLDGELAWFEVAKRYLHRDGRVIHVQLRVTLVRDGHGQPTSLLGVVHDVTEHIQARARLLDAALRDPLTGLPNRKSFLEHLRQVLTSGQEGDTAVLLLDLDHFKTVNESVGHHQGDRFLCLVAERIQGCLGQGHLLARYGGDEFAVLVAGPGAVATARAIAACIHRRMTSPMLLGGRDVYGSASVGLAAASTAGADADALLRDVDTALYRAKELGRARTVEFAATMRAALLERHALRHDLHKALERAQLGLHYQPIVALGADRVVGFEALLRWHHPERGLVPPDLFLPIAEQHGLSPGLGRFTLRTAICDLARMGDDPQGPTVAVNLSMRQLSDPGLLHCIDEQLALWEVDPRRLRIEVTEQVMADDLGQVLRVLQALRDRGIGISIDDFGTGVSSYAHLHRMPVDALKIDKAFVAGMVDGEEGRALVRSILGLARSLGLRAVAEGVETEEQRAMLLEMGCELGQGWLLGRPAPLP